eukprot:TRINITY_DN3861_c0_g1_i1.p1 TRINITY_DN3861_c0_g1~~TRINITY_DN3861_c0_g1_i1.p1  ORF type:complete len:154 (+),score=29.03 TRINITY_DN3861_c0_g1_i1:65-526(+)
MKKRFKTTAHLIELSNPFSNNTIIFKLPSTTKKSLVSAKKSRNGLENKSGTQLKTSTADNISFNESVMDEGMKEVFSLDNSASFLSNYTADTLLDLLSTLKESLITEQRIDIREVLIALSEQVQVLSEKMREMREYLKKRDKKVSLVHSKMLA